jgi:regulator of chromosome condensation
VQALGAYRIRDIAGGEHHSVACTVDGEVLAWGRSDGAQTGVPRAKLTDENAVLDDGGNPRILVRPEVLPGELGDAHARAPPSDLV